MDTAQALTVITGSGGALVTMFFWIKSLQASHKRLEGLLDKKDVDYSALLKSVTGLIVDVQRSLNEQTGCRFEAHHLDLVRAKKEDQDHAKH